MRCECGVETEHGRCATCRDMRYRSTIYRNSRKNKHLMDRIAHAQKAMDKAPIEESLDRALAWGPSQRQAVYWHKRGA